MHTAVTYALAQELGPRGIRVNAIHSGLIGTTMPVEDVLIYGTEAEAAFMNKIALGLGGTPKDVSGAAVFLGSALSQYVNGDF